MAGQLAVRPAVAGPLPSAYAPPPGAEQRLPRTRRRRRPGVPWPLRAAGGVVVLLGVVGTVGGLGALAVVGRHAFDDPPTGVARSFRLGLPALLAVLAVLLAGSAVRRVGRRLAGAGDEAPVAGALLAVAGAGAAELALRPHLLSGTRTWAVRVPGTAPRVVAQLPGPDTWGATRLVALAGVGLAGLALLLLLVGLLAERRLGETALVLLLGAAAVTGVVARADQAALERGRDRAAAVAACRTTAALRGALPAPTVAALCADPWSPDALDGGP